MNYLNRFNWFIPIVSQSALSSHGYDDHLPWLFLFLIMWSVSLLHVYVFSGQFGGIYGLSFRAKCVWLSSRGDLFNGVWHYLWKVMVYVMLWIVNQVLA